MNTHDVSTVPQYMQILLNQKQSLKYAQSRKGQHPKGRKSRDQLILQFRYRLLMRTSKRGEMAFNTQTSFIPPAYSPCLSSLSDLKKVMIDDLLLETHHRGNYLALRSVTSPDRMNAIMAIMEDEDKDAIMLQLYYQDKERAAEEILDEGVILIVKEPYFKLMSDGDYGLRVDHLSDIIYLPKYDERVPTCWQLGRAGHNMSASAWKAKGNDCFRQSKYHAAIEHYTTALNCSPTSEDAQSLRLNRSLAFLKVKQFDAALSDLESVPTTPKPAEKALFRQAQALYNLQRYRECSEALKVLRIEYPNNIEAKGELNRAINRLVEQENGRYMFRQLYAEATKLRPPHLDHATHIGSVSVKGAGTRGRGLFTTKAVKAGDLLLCEKAFAHIFIDNADATPNKDLTLLINAETDTGTMGAQAELIREIARKLFQNPSLAPAITDLHHGAYKSVGVSEVDSTPVVDTFLVERIISLNCFGCPLSSRQSHLRAVEDKAVQKTNKEEQFHSCGIWPMASYINHSCYSNARRAFIGDMMMVHATRDVEPDTEITFWYHEPITNGYDERQKKFQHWGFNCECAMCQDEKTTKKSVLAQRERLGADLSRCFQSGTRADIAKAESILATMTNTYRRPAFEVPRLWLWDAQLALARMYMQQNQPFKTIDWALRVLASLGYVLEGGNLPRTSGTPITVKKWGLMVDPLIECWMLLSGAYHWVAPDLEMQAEHYARISYKICVGEEETFDETYRKFAK